MTIAAVLRSKGSEVETINAHATVADAVSRLGAKRIGALPVVEGDEVVGIMSSDKEGEMPSRRKPKGSCARLIRAG